MSLLPKTTKARDNGIFQDGAILINLPAMDTWLAVFVAFQTQIWDTDNNGDVNSKG
jgi:uncharacterized protein YukJ